MAALKTVHVSSPSPHSIKIPKFAVIGHRGNGMNVLNSSDTRMKHVKENSILSFNTAASFPLDFVEFDVQVFFSSWLYLYAQQFDLLVVEFDCENHQISCWFMSIQFQFIRTQLYFFFFTKLFLFLVFSYEIFRFSHFPELRYDDFFAQFSREKKQIKYSNRVVLAGKTLITNTESYNFVEISFSQFNYH